MFKCIALVAMVSGAERSVAGPKESEIAYTPIADCNEREETPNAAFFKLACKSVGKFSLNINIQPPQFFNLKLTQQGTTIHREWDLLTKKGPVEPVKTLEWHMQNGEPKFLIFRMEYQLDYSVPNKKF